MRIGKQLFLAISILLLPLAAIADDSADLSISNTASPRPGTATAALTYSMNVFNNGPTVVATGVTVTDTDRKSTRLNSSHIQKSRMPSSA